MGVAVRWLRPLLPAQKLRDEDTEALSFTNVACRLLDLHSCACSDYHRRQLKVPDCIALTPKTLDEIDWLPPSCAYRRIQEGRGPCLVAPPRLRRPGERARRRHLRPRPRHQRGALGPARIPPGEVAGPQLPAETPGGISQFVARIVMRVSPLPSRITMRATAPARLLPRLTPASHHYTDGEPGQRDRPPSARTHAGALAAQQPRAPGQPAHRSARSGRDRHLAAPGRRARPGLRLLTDHATWVGTKLAALPPALAFVHGASIPIAGQPHRIRHRPGAIGGAWIEGREIHVSGDAAFLARRVTDLLRAEAGRRLGALAETVCAETKLRPGRIAIRDTRSRWGSCSPDGTVMFNWRLVMAPVAVQHYVVVHELAHLRHMNHGPQFWRLVEAHTPELAACMAWLKRHGAGLMRAGHPG